jgi:hypothetical protein
LNTEGDAEAYIPPPDQASKLRGDLESIKKQFKDLVLPVQKDRLHLSTTGLGPETGPFIMRVGRIQWDPEMGFFWPIEVYGNENDPNIQRLREWGRKLKRPPHITAAYFAKPFNKFNTELADQFVRSYPVESRTPFIVRGAEKVRFTDLSFNDEVERKGPIPFLGRSLNLWTDEERHGHSGEGAGDLESSIATLSEGSGSMCRNSLKMGRWPLTSTEL